MDYRIILYIIFGILPSLTWLFYYLRKDAHPEPKAMILKVFLWGALITLPVFFAQIGLKTILDKMALPYLASSLLYWFVVISFTEEFFKYLIVRAKIANNPAIDEPLDTMLYMVIAALGFAALENILYLFVPSGQMSFSEVVNRTIIVSFIRFIGATFLHTLCSGLLGYFFALSMGKIQTGVRYRYIVLGLALAVGLHGLYDFSIMTISGPLKVIMPITILVMLATFVFWAFDRLKKAKGLCIIKQQV